MPGPDRSLNIKVDVDSGAAIKDVERLTKTVNVFTNGIQTSSRTVKQLGQAMTENALIYDKDGKLISQIVKETVRYDNATKKATVNVSALNKKALSTYDNVLAGLKKVNESARVYENGSLKSVRTTGVLNGKMIEVSKTLNKQTGLWRTGTREVEQFNRGIFKTGDSFGKIILKVAQWTVATGALFGAMRALRGGLDTIVDIDDRMVMLTKVFQGTKDQLARVREEAFNVSVAMGNLVGSSIEATTEWAKMGRVGSELSEGLRVSLLGQNIAEIDAAEGAKLLNAAMLQFNISMDGAINILDEWNELSNRTTATTMDMGASVQQAGAIFNSAGAAIQDLNAYTAALISSMAKSGKEVGSALKTIGSYIRRQSSISKILETTGISIERQGGKLMDLDDIILQLAGSWQNLTDIEKEELAQTSAGVRRKAFFLNLMDNFSLVLDNYAIQWQAAGSAIRENEIRMDSLKTKLLQLSAAVEKMSIKTGDKGLIGLMKKSVDITRRQVDEFSDLHGGLQLLEIVTGAVSAKLAYNIIAAKKTAFSFNLLTSALSRTIGAFSKLLPAIGVIVTAGLVINALVGAINSEERALKSLNDERKKRIDLLNSEVAALKASKSQYDIFKGLVDQFRTMQKNGEDTTTVMSHLQKVWDNIDAANPGLLAGLKTMDEVLGKLAERARDASKIIDREVGISRKLELEIELSTKLNESKFKEDFDKFLSETHTIKTLALENIPTPSGISMKGRDYANMGIIPSIPSVEDEISKMAKKGNLDALKKTLTEYRDSLAQTQFVFSDDTDKRMRDVEEFLAEIERLESGIKPLSEMLGLDPNAPPFDSGLWSDYANSIKKVVKESDDLANSLDRIRDKGKTAADFYMEAMTVKGIDSQRPSSESLLRDRGPALDPGTVRLFLSGQGAIDERDKIEKSVEDLGKKIFELRQPMDEAEKRLLKLQLERISIEKAGDQVSVSMIDGEIKTASDSMDQLYKQIADYAAQYDEISSSKTAIGYEVEIQTNLRADIEEQIKQTEELISKDENNLEILHAKKSTQKDVVDQIDAALFSLEKTNAVYALLQQALKEITSEEQKQADLVRRQEEASARMLLIEQERIRRAIENAERETQRYKRSIITTLSEGVGDVIGSQLGDSIARSVGGGLRSDYVISAGRDLANSIGSILGTEVERRMSASLFGKTSDVVGLAVGSIAGAGVGALVSILADMIFGEETPAEKLTDEVQKNTLALQENTNAFQDFQERLINAPSTFALPALAGDATQGYGGGNTVDFISPGIGNSGSSTVNNSIDGVTIQIDGSKSPEATSRAVVAALDKIYHNSDNRGKNLAQEF